ncbi:MAG: hypothetical protein GX868_02125 [Actinobacteria bacterium]|nr:hypothetical protein [Actinomycetota bacterium]
MAGAMKRLPSISPLRRLVAALTTAGAVALSTLAVPGLGLAGAQPPVALPPEDPAAAAPSAPLAEPEMSLRSVSPWVESEGVFSATFEFSGFGPGTTLAYEIRQSVSGNETTRRETLAALRNGGAPGAILQRRRSVELSSITANNISTLQVPIRSTSGRRNDALYIPDAGTYPIDITVTDPAGPQLTARLYLNRLPAATATQGPPLRLAIAASFSQSMGTLEDGQLDEFELNSLRSVYRRYSELVDDADTLPIAVSLAPQSVGALERMDEAALSTLVDQLDGQRVFQTTWADLDLEAWATTGSFPSFQRSIDDGVETLDVRDLTPIDSAAWPIDDSIGPRSLAWLERLGVQTVLLSPDQVQEFTPDPGESGFTRRVEVAGDRVTLNGILADPELDRLASTDTDQPVLAAHQMLTLLAAQRQVDRSPRGSLLWVDDQTRSEVIEALLTMLNESLDNPTVMPAVVAISPEALVEIDRLVDADDDPVRVQISQRTVLNNVRSIDAKYETARELIDDYAALVGHTDPEAIRLATIVHRSLDRRIDVETQTGLLNDAIEAIDDDLSSVTLSKPRSLNVTERRTTIPLRIVNGLDRPITVTLRLKSSRLRFLDGEVQTLQLNPDLNRIDLNVEAQASGQFAMQAEVLVPGSDRVLASTRQTIRSTAFSGVGLILSGGALVFLVVWWLRTPRRRNDAPGEHREAPPTETEPTETEPAAAEPSAAEPAAPDTRGVVPPGS